MELNEHIRLKAETDSQLLALLGTTFTIAEELLPMVVSRIWNVLTESKETGAGVADNILSSFFYGETRLDAQIYIRGKEKILTWNSDQLRLPSLPFQAIFGKLQQLAVWLEMFC